MNGDIAWRAGEIVTVQYRVTHDHDDPQTPVSVELVGTGMMTGIWPENLRAAAAQPTPDPLEATLDRAVDLLNRIEDEKDTQLRDAKVRLAEALTAIDAAIQCETDLLDMYQRRTSLTTLDLAVADLKRDSLPKLKAAHDALAGSPS